MSNTRKAAQDRRKPTSAGQWKKNIETLTLPSGNVVLAKNPGISELAAKGLIPNSLMAIVLKGIKEGRQPAPEEILSDEVDMDDMFAMMDKAVIAVCVEPKVLPIPGDEADRDPEQLYIDEISSEDKEFIFGWVTGGTSDLEQFRAERTNLLGTIPGQPTVASSTE